MNEEAMAHWGVVAQKQTKKLLLPQRSSQPLQGGHLKSIIAFYLKRIERKGKVNHLFQKNFPPQNHSLLCSVETTIIDLRKIRHQPLHPHSFQL
jgi:hypothetical protein